MNQKLKIAAIACLAGIAVLSTGFSAMTLIRVKQLEENVSAVHSSVTNIDSDINSTLNSAVTTITQTAERAPALCPIIRSSGVSAARRIRRCR